MDPFLGIYFAYFSVTIVSMPCIVRLLLSRTICSSFMSSLNSMVVSRCQKIFGSMYSGLTIGSFAATPKRREWVVQPIDFPETSIRSSMPWAFFFIS